MLRMRSGSVLLLPSALLATLGVLSGCSASGEQSVGVETSAASSVPDPSPGAGPAEPQAPVTETPVPTSGPAVPTGPVRAESGSPAAAAPAAPSSVPEASWPASQQEAAATGFSRCAERYRATSAGVELGGAVTPLLLEQWATGFEASAALSAEGDPAGAAAACAQVLAAMESVLG